MTLTHFDARDANAPARPQQVPPEGLTRVQSREACAENPSPSAGAEGL